MLSYRTIGADGERRAMILHGVLGRKNNWSSIARSWTRSNPQMQVVLADLRLHGDSLEAQPPHTIAAAGQDVAELIEKIGGVQCLIGHSLGSKVATAAADLRNQAGHPPEQLWLIDGAPSADPAAARSSEGMAVLDKLKSLGRVFDSRESFVQTVVKEGLSEPIAQWLAMNLRQQPGGDVEFALDLDAIAQLLSDYFAYDGWHALERLDRTARHLVVGALSQSVGEGDQRRFTQIGQLHRIEEAGHWVHVQRPKAVTSMFVSSFQ